MVDNIPIHDVWMTTKRIETLVDGVFAIAMTLLVLSIPLPQIPGYATNLQLWNYLVGLSQQLWIYAFSFLLLASFWRAHHMQFFLIKQSDSVLIWINLLWLMFVALVPFSANFVTNYGSHQLAMLFFNFNMLIIGIFYIVNWTYADKKHFFIKELSQEQNSLQKRLNLIN